MVLAQDGLRFPNLAIPFPQLGVHSLGIGEQDGVLFDVEPVRLAAIGAARGDVGGQVEENLEVLRPDLASAQPADDAGQPRDLVSQMGLQRAGNARRQRREDIAVSKPFVEHHHSLGAGFIKRRRNVFCREGIKEPYLQHGQSRNSCSALQVRDDGLGCACRFPKQRYNQFRLRVPDPLEVAVRPAKLLSKLAAYFLDNRERIRQRRALIPLVAAVVIGREHGSVRHRVARREQRFERQKRRQKRIRFGRRGNLDALIGMSSRESPQVDQDGLADGEVLGDTVGLQEVVQGFLRVTGKDLDQAAVPDGVSVGVVSPDVDGCAGGAVPDEDDERKRGAAAVFQHLHHVEQALRGGSGPRAHILRAADDRRGRAVFALDVDDHAVHLPVGDPVGDLLGATGRGRDRVVGIASHARQAESPCRCCVPGK